jgi:hypothetical protein
MHGVESSGTAGVPARRDGTPPGGAASTGLCARLEGTWPLRGGGGALGYPVQTRHVPQIIGNDGDGPQVATFRAACVSGPHKSFDSRDEPRLAFPPEDRGRHRHGRCHPPTACRSAGLRGVVEGLSMRDAEATISVCMHRAARWMNAA